MKSKSKTLTFKEIKRNLKNDGSLSVLYKTVGHSRMLIFNEDDSSSTKLYQPPRAHIWVRDVISHRNYYIPSWTLFPVADDGYCGFGRWFKGISWMDEKCSICTAFISDDDYETLKKYGFVKYVNKTRIL